MVLVVRLPALIHLLQLLQTILDATGRRLRILCGHELRNGLAVDFDVLGLENAEEELEVSPGCFE